MKRKIFKLLLVAAGCISINAATLDTQAITEINGTNYWSLEEILNSEASTSATEMFQMRGITISSVNPSTNTIKIYYNDHPSDGMMFGIDEVYPLRSLTVFWAEEGTITGAHPLDYYANLVTSGVETPGLHPILIGSGTDWFPANTEVEITTDDINLVNNTNGKIYFSGSSAGSFIGAINYSRCLNSVDYEEGMECKAMFDNMSNTIYVAAVSSVPEPEPELEPEPIAILDPEHILTPGVPDPESDLEPESEPVPTMITSPAPELAVSAKPKTVEKTTVASATSAATATIDASTEPVSTVTTPILGKNNCSKTPEFPWWLVILMLIGDAIVLWWFLPNRQNYKKYQKT